MITYPTTLDVLVNPTPTNSVAVVSHALQHSNANDAIEALQAKLGIDSSAVITSHDYKLGEVIGTDKAVGKTATQTLTNKTLTAPVISTISNTGTITLPTATDTLVGKATTDILTNKTLTSPKVGVAILDTNGNEVIETPATGSAINHVKIVNASGSAVSIDAVGDSTDIDLYVKAKGAGNIRLGTAGLKFPNSDGTTGQALTTNATGSLSFSTFNSFPNRFGGTGADGALAITTGTTDINLGAVAVVVKNYTSISITGNGKLTFSNPHANGTIIILKSQGNVTLTSSEASMIDASGMGAAGGGVYTNGTGTAWVFDTAIHYGKGATGTQGAGGLIIPPHLLYTRVATDISRSKSIAIITGSGGGGGYAGRAGGAGGGGLYIECLGTFNFNKALGISVAGKVGSNTAGYGAGGGGSAGSAVILYNTAGTITGTINSEGGAGGTASNTAGGGAGGGGGGSLAGAGGAGGAQGAGAAGGNGAGGGGGGAYSGTGGAGGAGGASSDTLIALNTEFY